MKYVEALCWLRKRSDYNVVSHLIFRIIDNYINDEHAAQTCQFDGISYFLFTFTENVPSVAQHEQKIFEDTVIRWCTRVFAVRNSNELHEFSDTTLILCEIQWTDQRWPIELIVVVEDNFWCLTKRHNAQTATFEQCQCLWYQRNCLQCQLFRIIVVHWFGVIDGNCDFVVALSRLRSTQPNFIFAKLGRDVWNDLGIWKTIKQGFNNLWGNQTKLNESQKRSTNLFHVDATTSSVITFQSCAFGWFQNQTQLFTQLTCIWQHFIASRLPQFEIFTCRIDQLIGRSLFFVHLSDV